MSKPYFTLAVLEPGKPWAPQFGDYNKAFVQAEASDYRDRGYKRSQLKIITSGALQTDINAAIAMLNVLLPPAKEP